MEDLGVAWKGEERAEGAEEREMRRGVCVGAIDGSTGDGCPAATVKRGRGRPRKEEERNREKAVGRIDKYLTRGGEAQGEVDGGPFARSSRLSRTPTKTRTNNLGGGGEECEKGEVGDSTECGEGGGGFVEEGGGGSCRKSINDRKGRESVSVGVDAPYEGEEVVARERAEVTVARGNDEGSEGYETGAEKDLVAKLGREVFRRVEEWMKREMELRLDELQKRIMVEWGLERGKRGRECDGWIRQQVDEEGTRVVNERVERNKEVCGKGVESQSEVRRLQEELRGAKERAAWERVK
ncbi:hypothetical protein M0802_015054 [Mischocyttarus mexicanus]|nr:hypothetical protein M0802_015054 [Mischocyttarus mexicanus]